MTHKRIKTICKPEPHFNKCFKTSSKKITLKSLSSINIAGLFPMTLFTKPLSEFCSASIIKTFSFLAPISNWYAKILELVHK